MGPIGFDVEDASSRFVLPMNVATRTSAGSSYNCRGVPVCRISPSPITTMVSERLIALGLIMGDVDRRHADLAVQRFELVAHFLAKLGVEVRQRLVEQQNLRRIREGASERHPLLLPAGQLMRIAVDEGWSRTCQRASQ